MERLKKDLGRHFWRRVVCCFLAFCLVWSTSIQVAMALGPGDVTGVTGGPTVGAVLPAGPGPWVDPTIQTEHGAIIDWSNFDTLPGETLTFQQYDVLGGSLSATSAVLNRITSATATHLDGALNANGRVFIVNPAGIIFGTGSTVNVSQLVAAGMNMSDDAFNAILAAGPGDQWAFEGVTGEVRNFGTVEAGRVYLIGKKVFNGYVVGGDDVVILAAGDNVYLAQDGSNVLVQVLADPGNTTPDIDNRSNIKVDPRGTIVLAAGDDFSRAVRSAGLSTARGGSVTYQAARVEARDWINVVGQGPADDGGTVLLDGQESVTAGLLRNSDGTPRVGSGWIRASGGANGNGGSVTLQTEGTLTIEPGFEISARGGATSGDGGMVTIVADNFSVGNDPLGPAVVDASNQNAANAPGTLEIQTPNVTIANGANPGDSVPNPPTLAPLDTLYEQDIEGLSNGLLPNTGTNLIVRAQDSVNVQDLTDDGAITGGVGGIELHATNPTGSVAFANPANTISTTRGNLAVTAGSGGANIGILQTGDPAATPGQISVATTDGGNVSVGGLTITDGLGHAEIGVDASGNLTTNGPVQVGSNSPINNVSPAQSGEAIIGLSAGGDVELNGPVNAAAVGTAAAGGTTTADIQISGNNVAVNDALVATAQSPADGASYASIEVDATNALTFGPGAPMPHAQAGDAGEVDAESYTTLEVTANGDTARIITLEALLQGFPDFDETHMGTPVSGTVNVLDNDVNPGGDPISVALDTDVTHGTLTLNPDGTYSYTPDAGYVGDDTFTYTATAGGDTTDPILVTITMTNALPTADGEAASTHMGVAVGGTIADNIADADGDPLATALVTDVTNGTLTLNPDGTYSYTPNAGYVGGDSFTYSVADPEISAVPTEAIVTIDVTNTLPAPQNDTANTHMNVPVVINVLGNDTDPNPEDAGSLAVVLDGTPPTNGTVVLNEDGTFTYTPNEGFVGNDSFTYDTTDGQLDGGSPVVVPGTLVEISVGNAQPVPVNDAATTVAGKPVGGNVLANDSDPENDPLTVVLDGTSPANGVVVLNTDGTFTYTPNKGFVGEDSFAYEVSDGQGGATNPTAMVTITVNEDRSLMNVPAAPGLDVRIEPEISGYPALVKWVAKELGVDEKMIEVWFANTLASARDIPPYDAYSRFKNAARILQDRGGKYSNALTEVIGEFAQSTAPPTEEQMASIAEALARNTDSDSVYARANLYLDSLTDYVVFLVSEMGFAEEDAVAFVTTKYVDQLAGGQNVGLAGYVAAKLASLYEDTID